MRPACPRCDSGSTRRNRRNASLKHKFMYLVGRFPWECLTCERHFFSGMRYARSSRSPHGEVYFRGPQPGHGRERDQYPVSGHTVAPAQYSAQGRLNFDSSGPAHQG